MPYELHLNLQQRAALKIAISFWERNEVKNKAAEIFKICNKFKSHEIKRKWAEFTKSVVDEWNKDELPQTLQVDLIHLIKLIKYGAAEEAINCIDQIKWTPYGTVDVVNTFKSSWLKNPNLDITKVYNFACRNAMEDYIDDLWHKIPRNKQNDYYEHIYDYFDQHILAYWKCCRDNDLPNLMRYCQAAVYDFNEEDIQDFVVFNGEDVYNFLYDLSRSIEENMLRLTVYQGNFNAMKCFWDKLTKQEREESVLKCARITVLRWDYYSNKHKNTSDYKIRQCLEICIFLMNQMTTNVKKSFFNGKVEFELGFLHHEQYDVRSRILGMLLSTWPWEELFMPILEDMLRYIDNDSQMDCQFLDAIIFYICEDHELGYSLKTSKYRFLLREVWLIIPAPIKRKIVEENLLFSFMNNLIEVWDMDNLNLIINDPAIADVRDQFIDRGSSSYETIVAEDQFEKLDQLMEKLFKFDEKKKNSFKQNLNPWRKIFENREVNVANKFLDWQSSSRKERRFLKNNINHMELCETFINHSNFEVLDKVLNWKFETIEERIRCEDHLKSDVFVIKKVYDMWRWFIRVVDIAKDKSSRFLDWVFESDNEIRCFKKEKLINIEIDQIVIDALVMFREFCIIDEFLSWCLLDNTEIEQIKQVISVRNPRLTQAYVQVRKSSPK